MAEINLKDNFVMIGYLRDRILKYFTEIEKGTISVSITNKAVLDKISDAIQDFIKRVSAITDIHEYSDIPFKMKGKDGKIVFRPFTSQELEDMNKLWQEDSSTFETQFEMYVYAYALKQKAASTARLYNTKAIGQPMTAEDAYRILELTVLSDMHQFIFYHSFLKRLVYSVVPGITVKRTLDSLLADYRPVAKATIEEKQRLMRNLSLYESLSYGFYNPYDSDDSQDDAHALDTEGDDEEDDKDVTKPISAKDIKSIVNWNQDVPSKIIYKTGKMLAGRYFGIGDVIEKCPIKFMSEADLYSKTIRDNVFPIDMKKGIYAFPLGNALCYRNSDEAARPGNIVYEYDDTTECLVFTAVKRIRKGEELILQVTSDDYANALKPGQFKYDNEPDVVYTTKNIQII